MWSDEDFFFLKQEWFQYDLASYEEPYDREQGLKFDATDIVDQTVPYCGGLSCAAAAKSRL